MRVIPKAEIKRRWDEVRAERVRKARKKADKRIRGLGLTVRLEDGRTLAFRGRQYEVPPVPWRVALGILEAEEQFRALQEQKAPKMADWLTLYQGVGRLFKEAARPAHGWRRWLWKLVPTPLRDATPSEVGEALRFFSLCLIMDHGESWAGNLRHLGISQPTSEGSSATSQNGAKVGVP